MKIFKVLAVLSTTLFFSATGARSQSADAMDRHVADLENLLPRLTDLASQCEDDTCAPRVCEAKLDVFRDLSNIEPVLNRYVLLLNAEDALLTRATDDAIANNDRSAAALEGARIAASMTHVTDQMLGAVVELNGIAGFVSAPSSDPEAIWEAAKDVNSIINRLYDGWADTGNQIESVRYNPELASGEGTGINLKNLEDAYIDIWAVGPKAAAGLLPENVRELGSGVDPTQVVKDNTSNALEVWATAKGMLEAVAELKRAQELGSLMEDAGQGYIDRALPHLKGSVKKRVDAAIKEQQALVGQQKRKTANAVAFGLTQVAARLVQNYYSKEKLQAFRNRISQLRDMNRKAGDAYLDLIVERDAVRSKNRKVMRQLETVRALGSRLRECAFRSCGGNFSSLPMVTLPPVEKKRNGNVRYMQGKTEIEPIMAALVGSLSSNLANGGGTTPRFPQGTRMSGPSFFGSGNGPGCEACQNYHDDAAGISRQIEMILWRLDNLDQQEDLAELKYQRNVSLRDAEGWQAEYNRRTDGSIGRRLKNLTDDEIQGLSELGSQIRRATSRVKALGQRIRAVEATDRQTAVLKQELETLRDREKDALERLELCNRKVCGEGLSTFELLHSSPLFEAEAARAEECREEQSTALLPAPLACEASFRILSAGLGAHVVPIASACTAVTPQGETVTYDCPKGDLFAVLEKGKPATKAMSADEAQAYARERNRYVDVEDNGRVYEMLKEDARARLQAEYERLDSCAVNSLPLVIPDAVGAGAPIIQGSQTIEDQARQLLSAPEIPDPFDGGLGDLQILGVGEGKGYLGGD